MLKVRPTLIIGLGEMGRRTALLFKKRVVAKHGDLPSIRVFVIDIPSGGEEESSSVTLTPVEEISLSIADIDSFALRTDGPDWLPDGLTYGPDGNIHDARAQGKLALYGGIQDVRSAMENAIRQLFNWANIGIMAEKGFEVERMGETMAPASLHIVSSLTEPEASGLLLDVAYLAAHLFKGMRFNATGILFLPHPFERRPEAKPNAYAALKELDHFMEGGFYEADYGPIFHTKSEASPFDRACYLIGFTDENGNILGDPDELAAMVAEWLYQTNVSPMREGMSNYLDNLMMAGRLEGKRTAYSSFGLAAYVVPVGDLIHWCAYRMASGVLGGEILRPLPFKMAVDRLGGFLAKTRMRPDFDGLLGQISLDKEGRRLAVSEGLFAQLGSAPLSELEARVRSTFRTIQAQALPAFQERMEENVERALIETAKAIEEEVTAILDSQPAGGLSLANQFLEGLRRDLASFSEHIQQDEQQYRHHSKRMVSGLSRLGGTLKSAVASIPSRFVLSLGVLAAFFLPTFQLFRLIRSIVWPRDAMLGAVTLSILLLGSLGALAFAFLRTFGFVNEVRSEYIARLRGRFTAETNILAIKAATDFYARAKEIVDSEFDKLSHFAERLAQMNTWLKRQKESIDALYGHVGFPAQTSVLAPDIVDELYEQYVSEPQVQLTQMLQDMGSLATWRRKQPGDLLERIVDHCRGRFAGLRGLKVESLLERSNPTAEEMQRRMKELILKSAPLWSYDRYKVGEVGRRRPIIVGGVDHPLESQLDNILEYVRPEVRISATGDGQSVSVISIRHGLPLFALAGVDEYKNQYDEVMRRMSLPLHTERRFALLPDLAPVYEERLDSPTGFALGRAFGLIEVDEEGFYVFQREKLSQGKEESCAILAGDEETSADLDRAINAKVSDMSGAEAAEYLHAYLEEKEDLAHWEGESINRYIEALRG